jgi:hypothetical protein
MEIPIEQLRRLKHGEQTVMQQIREADEWMGTVL